MQSRVFCFVAVLLGVSIAGCGGGGSSVPSPSSPSSGSGGGAPATVPSSASFYTVQAVLSAFSVAGTLARFGPTGTSQVSVDGLRRAALGTRRVADVACTAGFTETALPDGEHGTLITDTYYYDTACSKPREVDVIDQSTAPASGVTDATENGTLTGYDTSGNVESYRTVALTAQTSTASTTFSEQVSVGPYASAQASSVLGVGCAATAAMGDCSAALVTLPLSIPTYGANASDTITISPTANSSETLALQMSVNAYVGSALSITSSPTFAWAVTGDSQSIVDTTTGAGSFSYDATRQLTAANLSATDALSGLAISETSTNTGTSGSVTKSGTTVATFKTDANGDGTLTYSDGTTAPITAYQLTVVS